MKPLSLREYCEKQSAEVDHFLAKHVLLHHQHGRTTVWTLGRANGDGFYRAQVIASPAFHSLVVIGDIDPVVFQYGSGNAQQIVEWIGLSHIDYVLEKASIGTGYDATHSWSPEVALYYVLDVLANEPEIERSKEDSWKAIQVMIERGDDRLDIERAVNETDWECSNLGQVPAVRVVQAWRICKKLTDLLVAKVPPLEGNPAEGGT